MIHDQNDRLYDCQIFHTFDALHFMHVVRHDVIFPLKKNDFNIYTKNGSYDDITFSMYLDLSTSTSGYLEYDPYF